MPKIGGKSMTQKPTVTIGIPAYNEEANIKKLLLSILSQKEEGFVIKEIIVISDGSSDRTVQEAKSLDDKQVKVIRREERRGQAVRLNEIFNRADSGFVVLLDADILIANNDFIASLVRAFRIKKNIGIVAAKLLPLSTEGLIGETLKWHASWKRALYGKIDNADNIYLCHGAARCFSKDAYKSLRSPPISSEDAYSYLAVKRMGMGFVFCEDAVAYFQPPLTLSDHMRQSVRFLKHNKALSPYFTKEELNKAYSIPKKIFIKSAFRGLINDPLKAIVYVAIYAYCKALAISFRSNSNFHLWETSTSTKTLNTVQKT